jgi:hypothetical protein
MQHRRPTLLAQDLDDLGARLRSEAGRAVVDIPEADDRLAVRDPGRHARGRGRVDGRARRPAAAFLVAIYQGVPFTRAPGDAGAVASVA